MTRGRQFTAWVAYTHLFRGVQVTLVGGNGVRPDACQLDLSFSDGVGVRAELLSGDSPDDAVLAVPSYTTAAGTALPARVWPVADWSAGPDGTQRFRLGPRLPLSGA